jgi:V/A-type H+/Na+-transporting ATPase subunit K
MSDSVNVFFDPAVLSLVGVAISAGLAAIGSSIGSGYVASISAGLVAKEPSKFAQVLILSALPSSQALYGLLYAIIILLRTGLLNGQLVEGMTSEIGMQFLLSALPVGVACLISAIYQGKVAGAGVKIVAESPENSNQAIVLAALIESFAIFGLIVSILIGFIGIQIP